MTADGAGPDALPTDTMDGNHLLAALRSGLARVIATQEHLNKINVFPVPDGDTGTNLALTLAAVAAALKMAPPGGVGKLMQRIADAALDGARGNSGSILAQFFLGASDGIGEAQRIKPAGFAAAATRGAVYAREALSDPVEGTILTVIDDVAAALRDTVEGDPGTGFADLFDTGLVAARRSLARTPDLNDALRRAGVVDAGAEGFVELFAGMRDYLVDGVEHAIPEGAMSAGGLTEHGFEDTAGETTPLTARYCTECMVTGENIDRRVLREQLSELGESLVVAGTHRKARVHVHTDEPDAVFSLAGRFGAVSAQKADDMQRQQTASHAAARRVAIITDTAADIADETVERLDIHFTPVRIHFGEHSYLDKVSITEDRFYELLRTDPHHPTTSQPAPGDFRRHYQFLASHFDAVVSLHVSAAVSGTYQAARSAAGRAASDGRVHVVDSENASLGQGLLAMHAAECAQAGMDVDAVLDAIETMRPRTRSFALLRNLDYSVRGGRVSRRVQRIAQFARLTPVLATRRGGTIGVGGALFGRRRLVERFARYVARRTDPARSYRVAVGHADCEADGKLLERVLAERIARIETLTFTRIGSALGVHAGPEGLVVALQERDG